MCGVLRGALGLGGALTRVLGTDALVVDAISPSIFHRVFLGLPPAQSP